MKSDALSDKILYAKPDFNPFYLPGIFLTKSFVFILQIGFSSGKLQRKTSELAIS
jgi:hypothetical protein